MIILYLVGACKKSPVMRRCRPLPLRPVAVILQMHSLSSLSLIITSCWQKRKKKKKLRAHIDNRASLASGEFAAYCSSLPNSVLVVSLGGPRSRQQPSLPSSIFQTATVWSLPTPSAFHILPQTKALARAWWSAAGLRNVFSQSFSGLVWFRQMRRQTRRRDGGARFKTVRIRGVWQRNTAKVPWSKSKREVESSAQLLPGSFWYFHAEMKKIQKIKRMIMCIWCKPCTVKEV